MSFAIAVVAGTGVLLVWARQRRRMERITRALHELRTPLCAARLAVHAAGRERGWPAVARIDEELGRAALALDDLDAARQGRRVAPRREDVDTGELLDEVGATWAPLAWPVDRQVRVEPSIAAPVVHADPVRLAQALGNLVGNALEHGAGDVVLAVSVEDRWVRLTVGDAGGGLPVPLGRMWRRARGGRGSRGRGLAIAAEVAHRHGGRLESDAPGTAGCRMTIVLPLPVREGDESPTWSVRRGGSDRGRPAEGNVTLDLGGLRVGGTVRPLRRRP